MSGRVVDPVWLEPEVNNTKCRFRRVCIPVRSRARGKSRPADEYHPEPKILGGVLVDSGLSSKSDYFFSILVPVSDKAKNWRECMRQQGGIDVVVGLE